MALNRNFRTTYYKTLGVPVVQHIVDVEASYAALLAEPVVNRAQAVKLAQEIGIPPHYRDLVWQLLASVLPPHTAIWDFAIQERTLMYQDVVDVAQVLQPSAVAAGSNADLDDNSPCCADFQANVMTLTDCDDNKSDEAIAHTDMAELVAVLDGADANNELSAVRSKATKVVSKKDRVRLVQLHRTYWTEIMVRKPLRGMDDELYLDRVASIICDVVAGEMERFWCFTKLLELFHDGMGQFKPVVTLQSFHEISSVADFEALFIRILEALKRDKES
ncbi:hypothetical protein Gpo141_00006487 [Globisporangium polare]